MKFRNFLKSNFPAWADSTLSLMRTSIAHEIRDSNADNFWYQSTFAKWTTRPSLPAISRKQMTTPHSHAHSLAYTLRKHSALHENQTTRCGNKNLSETSTVTKHWSSLRSVDNSIYNNCIMLVSYVNKTSIAKEHQRVVVDATGFWHIARSTRVMWFLWPDNDIEQAFIKFSVIILQTNFLYKN